MYHRKNSHHRQTPHHPAKGGYTLSEMLVVLLIMAVLFTISGRIFLDERDRFEFNAALSKIMQTVRSARTYATSTTPVVASGVGNVVPVDGYGIFFEMSEAPGQSVITVFANLAENPQTPHASNDPRLNRFDKDTDIVMERYTLPRQIAFRKFWFDKVEMGNEPDDGFVAQWSTDEEDPGPTALESIVFFNPPLAESRIVGFRESSPTNPVSLSNLKIEFLNPQVTDGSDKRCQTITLNPVKTFPELSYSSSCQ